MGTETEQRRIELGAAWLEVTLGGSAGPGTPTICAAHPAGAFGESTVLLLRDTATTRVVCINPRGIGASAPPAPGQNYDLDDMVDDVEAVRGQLGLGPWVFWGMSGGGWLGQLYARGYPEALVGLILESVCACFRVRLADTTCVLSPFHDSWRPVLVGEGLIAPDSHDATGDLDALEWTSVDGVGSVFRRRQGPALLVSPTPLSPEMRRAMPALWAVDTRSWLPAVRTPTLVMCGSSDPVLPVPHAVALQRAIPGSQLVIVEGGGHAPVTERRPQVADVVRRFLRDRVQQAEP